MSEAAAKKTHTPGVTPTPAKEFTELLAMALECAMRLGQGKSSNGSKAKKLQAQILEFHASLLERVGTLEKALRDLHSSAIVLTEDYLKLWEREPDSLTVQGWSLGQWRKLLAAHGSAESVLKAGGKQ